MPRREYKIGQQQDEWDLIVDCPFNGNKDNKASSGIVIAGNASFISDPVTSDVKVARFLSSTEILNISTNDFSYNEHNAFRLELDFYCLGTKSYNNIVDTSASGGMGIYTQIISNNWEICVTSKNDGTDSKKLKVSLSNAPHNNWYHLFIEKYNFTTTYIISKDNIVIGNVHYDNIPNITYIRNRLTIGGSGAYSGRVLNGYIKNFKLYKHI